MPRQKSFDRKTEDIGNILAFEHVNLTVPDQALATLFYVSGLGLTRDPYVDFGSFNVWVNSGAQQFHLPTGKPQVLRGEIGLAVPDLTSLANRLNKLAPRFANTKFAVEPQKNELLVTCPWGNRIRCFISPAMPLGISYLQLLVEKSKLPGIARFYQTIFSVPISLKSNRLDVTVGVDQTLRFKAAKKIPVYDGHHIAIYTPDFSGPYNKIHEHGQIMEESDQHQYRFLNIFDPDSGEVLYELEHEVRSLRHPMFNRSLLNRNSEQSFNRYTKGQDAFYPR
ncbi:MAG: catechol 2,3-dioxygenase-like lactoylglutathione lyase family enzyme [Candidatus Azotimanducaceae bacterium]|jgi:catechol 2,3-dioxygenase-like lactoylglutathione lyase family enzyme